MSYQNHSRPIDFLPMPQTEFEQRLNGQIQDFTLHDAEELRRITEFNRGTIREQQKSQLRQAEFQTKEAAKIKINRFIVRDGNVILQKFNGLGTLVCEQLLFRCQVEQVQRFKREGEEDELWQVLFRENNGRVKSISPLYRYELLQSETKLRKTVLANYDCTSDARSKSDAWHWMRSQLLNLFGQAEILPLPSKAGWYWTHGCWHFWTAADEQSLLLNEQIKRCHIPHFGELDAERVIASLLEETKGFSSEAQAESLLLLRLSALLGRLTGGMSKPCGIVLIGEEAEDLAKNLLCTMETDADVSNLDSDRLGNIRERVKNLQDSPMLFLSSDPDNRSVQNRLREVLSWLDSGYIEGVKITVPFVFCLRNFSKNYPLDGMVLFETNKQMTGQKYSSFAMLQQIITSRIEADSGWVERIRKIFANFSVGGRKDDKARALFQTIVNILLNMFQLELCNGTFIAFKKFLHLGEKEIDRQLCKSRQILVEAFRDKVMELVEIGKLQIMERRNAFFLMEQDVVYYDEEFYYFEKKALKGIRYEMDVDNKSLLYIKQQLIERGAVKQYKSDGIRRQELEVDFIVNFIGEGKQSRSGFAIRKEFWDVPGGVALFERGLK